MALPARVFWTLEDLSARWGCAPVDIVGWATMDIIEIVTSIGLVRCSDAEPLGGLVVVCAEDILPLFRRNRQDTKACALWRVRAQGSAAWRIITDPDRGVTVEPGDLLVTAATARRFEEEYDPLQRVHVSPGRSTRHDWEGMLQFLMIRLFEHGLPESQADFVAEGQDWFVAYAKDGSVPDESQIRRKLSPIWRALKQPQ